MIFCPKCGTIIMPKKIANKTKLACPKCYYKITQKKESLILKEKLENKEKIEVVDKSFETLPKVDQTCPKCKNSKAYFWLLQTRSADEAETTFYKCTKCNHTWRTY